MVSRQLMHVALTRQEVWCEGLEEASRLFFGEGGWEEREEAIALLESLHVRMGGGGWVGEEEEEEEEEEMRSVLAFAHGYEGELAQAYTWLRRWKVTKVEADICQVGRRGDPPTRPPRAAAHSNHLLLLYPITHVSTHTGLGDLLRRLPLPLLLPHHPQTPRLTARRSSAPHPQSQRPLPSRPRYPTHLSSTAEQLVQPPISPLSHPPTHLGIYKPTQPPTTIHSFHPTILVLSSKQHPTHLPIQSSSTHPPTHPPRHL